MVGGLMRWHNLFGTAIHRDNSFASNFLNISNCLIGKKRNKHNLRKEITFNLTEKMNKNFL